MNKLNVVKAKGQIYKQNHLYKTRQSLEDNSRGIKACVDTTSTCAEAGGSKTAKQCL